MLTAHPDINVIYATGDPQLQGGLAAAASQGRDIAFLAGTTSAALPGAARGRPHQGLPEADHRTWAARWPCACS